MAQQKAKSVDLGVLQSEAENAARQLKAANTALSNARATVARAEEAYSVAQKALALGTESVKAATRVN